MGSIDRTAGFSPLPVSPIAVALSSFVVVVVSAAFRSVIVNEIMFDLCLAVVIVITARLGRQGRLPDAVSGVILPVALSLWLVGHLAETYQVIRFRAPKPVSPSDIAFSLALVGLGFIASRLWVRTATYSDRGALLRTGLDTLLCSAGIFVVYWIVFVPWVARPDASMEGLLLSGVYAFFSSTVAASQVTRAWQRRDAGSWSLAAAALLAVTGVLIWTVAKFGPDLRSLGVMFMTLGVLVLPMAIAHPAHHRLVVVQEIGERDRMGSLALHLACWAVAYLSMVGHRVTVGAVVMALSSIVLIYLRVFLVRSSEQRLVQRLRVLAFTDPLTGIGNRRSLLSLLERLGEGWLITIDLDGFKEVNDEYGHDAGDEVLRGFVERTQAALPSDAHLARIGGDEFGVLFTGDRGDAVQLGERIVEVARDPHYARLTASVGLTWHASGADPNKTVRDSDIAMQEAKRAGKNRLAVLTTAMVDNRLRDLRVGARLANSLGDLTVVYQPIVALSPGYPLVAVEALARWNHPELGPVSPAEFIPIAEQQGMVGEVGRVVLAKAMAQLKTWLDEGRPRQMSLNVSWLQLRTPATVESLADVIRQEPRAAEWLVLEVTETVFTEDEGAVVAIQMLRDLGVCIAVDDFGTGASNLRRLRSFPIDVLKIDRSLLEGLGRDSAAEAVLSMVSRLGEALGMAVIAEGVETAATARTLGQLGVTAAQGYLFAKPMPADQVPAPIQLPQPWLGRRSRASKP